MTKETKGTVLVMLSILGLMGTVGAVELMPADAGLQQWLLILAMVCGFGSSGMAGASYLKEAEEYRSKVVDNPTLW